MAGKGLQDLGLSNEALPSQAFDDLPEFGTYAPPPQPGPYRFQLPGSLSNVWETFDGKKGQRIRVIFDKDAPLLITASPGGRANHDTFNTRISNDERKRGKDGPEASDMDYLLKAFGVKTRPASNAAYAQALLGFAGKEFGADVSYSWGCSAAKDIYVKNAEGKSEKVEGHKGCGAKYYQKDVPKAADGTYAQEIGCSCGAVIRCFANLENFRA